MSTLAIAGLAMGGLILVSLLALLACRAFHIQRQDQVFTPARISGKADEGLDALLERPAERGYDDGKALACARAAALAYQDEAAVKICARSWGWPGARVVECKHRRAIVLMRDDVVLIAFRGTRPGDGYDWACNTHVAPHSTPWGSVHGGWWLALGTLWPKLAHILSQRQEGSNVWLTGHSMGASLALLAAAQRLMDDGDVGGVYTFGQPTVASADFGQRVGSLLRLRYFRFIYSSDPVIGTGFRQHCGTPMYFDASGRLFEGEPSPCQSLIDHAVTNIREGSEFKAHPIRRYVQLLELRLGTREPQTTT